MINETGWSQLTGSPDKRICQPQQLITLQLIGARLSSLYSADNEETVYLYIIPADDDNGSYDQLFYEIAVL